MRTQSVLARSITRGRGAVSCQHPTQTRHSHAKTRSQNANSASGPLGQEAKMPEWHVGFLVCIQTACADEKVVRSRPNARGVPCLQVLCVCVRLALTHFYVTATGRTTRLQTSKLFIFRTSYTHSLVSVCIPTSWWISR